MESKNSFASKLNSWQQKYLPFCPQTVKKLAILATVLIGWVLLWALLLKMCDTTMLVRNYTNLKEMTPLERVMWDIVPFRYRGTDYLQTQQKLATVLNCFVFVPFGVLFCHIFSKDNLLRNAVICLGISLTIELLQFVTMFGNPATEDLITNTLGCFVGYGLNALIFRRMSAKSKVVVFAIVNVILIAASIYAVVTVFGAVDTMHAILTRRL